MGGDTSPQHVDNTAFNILACSTAMAALGPLAEGITLSHWLWSQVGFMTRGPERDNTVIGI